MLGFLRPEKLLEQQPGPDQTAIGVASMAKALDATNACGLKPRSGVPALLARFERKVDRSSEAGPNGDCHEWQGRVDGRGYGEIKVGGKYKKAHRLALFGFEDWDNPLFACHRCDNPRCVNPEHLFAGEAVDNVRDMIAKGRSCHSGGGLRPTRKLNDQQVAQVVSDRRSSRDLSAELGVSRFTIQAIRRGDLYRDVVAKVGFA